MGSVKDLKIIKPVTEKESGTGQFNFSDRYSVFDWGEMPDLIKDKGRSLCILGAFFFEKLEKMGVITHYQGLVENGTVKHLAQLKQPSGVMQVSLVRVLKPKAEKTVYDYSPYQSKPVNCLIPLEVIYRNSLPAGSSVFKRLQNGSLALADLGLDRMPEPNTILPSPLLDCSTKLEATDRYLSWPEARQISGMSEQEFTELKTTTRLINDLITNQAKAAGLFNEDGKVEFAFDTLRKLMLVDVLGTPDECRFTSNGIPVSKEVARIFYRKTSWFKDLEAAKMKDRVNWKKIVTSQPPKLPKRLFELIGHLYQSTCNEITQRRWFAVPALPTILQYIREQIED
jgi:phosphoribosylaminoimidazole-succinocarboxamide synthase